MSLLAVAEEIVAVLEAAFASVTDVSVQVEPRRVFNPSPPTIDVYPADPFRILEGAGMGDVHGACVFTVRARVHTADTDAGQDVLLAFMDDDDDLCVARALLDEPTLNGYAMDLDVDGPSGYRVYVDPSGDGAYLGVEWQVKVLRALS